MQIKLRLVAAAALSSLLLATAVAVPAGAHERGVGFLCYGNYSNIAMYIDGPPGSNPGWALQYGEGFRGHQTVLVGGVFWSYGHSASSYPYDYWLRTDRLRC